MKYGLIITMLVPILVAFDWNIKLKFSFLGILDLLKKKKNLTYVQVDFHYHNKPRMVHCSLNFKEEKLRK